MARTKLYAGIFVLLATLSTVQAGLEFTGLLDENYWPIFAIIFALSLVKAAVVAEYYQHLHWEPRSVTALMVVGLFAVLALIGAASYSIT